MNNGNLSTAVSAFEVVTAGGDVLSIARSKELRTFQATVVNLGALGVVTKVTLNVEPAFTMRQDVYLDLPMAQVREHFEDIVAAGYSVSLFTDWQKGRVNEVWVKRRVEKSETLTASAGFLRRTPPRRRTFTRSSSSPLRIAPSRWAFPGRGTVAPAALPHGLHAQ